MNKRYLFFIYAFLLVGTMSFSSSLTLKQNTDSLITFPVTFNGNNAPTGTTCNYSIIYPNLTLMIENDKANYTNTGIGSFIISDNSINGEYQAPLTCTFLDGSSESGSADFTITPSGEDPSGAQISVYLGLILILFILLGGIIFILFEIDSFAWRMGLTSFAYIIANVFLLVCWKTAEMFLTAIPFLEIVFRVLYIVSNAGYFPMFGFVLVYSLLHMTDQKNIETLMNRGFTEDQAKWRTKN